ncbi:ETX/MTX2 family pore-forming toxin [Bacillus thuringiensis]|nr:ETX/MTX2 family pore-forming toxin [Bacillus thuringiensis]
MAIFDLDAYLLKLKKEEFSVFEMMMTVRGVDSSKLAIQNAESYGLEIIESKPQGEMFLGESILRNQTNESQIINSDTFTKTITDSVTLSVTNGISTGVEITIGGKIFGVGAETSMSFEVSTSTTNEQTSEESVSYTVPSQPVSMPPQSIRYVYASLERNQLKGLVKLKTIYLVNLK